MCVIFLYFWDSYTKIEDLLLQIYSNNYFFLERLEKLKLCDDSTPVFLDHANASHPLLIGFTRVFIFPDHSIVQYHTRPSPTSRHQN